MKTSSIGAPQLAARYVELERAANEKAGPETRSALATFLAQLQASGVDVESFKSHPIDREKLLHDALDRQTAFEQLVETTAADLGWQVAAQPSTKTIDLQSIETHLTSLGAGNQVDNVRSLTGFSKYFDIALSKDDFLKLVFLDNSSVKPLIHDGDRRLQSVARQAENLGSVTLAQNWDLGRIHERFKDGAPKPEDFPALVLRDARGSETSNGGRWYIQDGLHRALAYAVAVVSGRAEYHPVRALVATNENLEKAAQVTPRRTGTAGT